MAVLRQQLVFLERMAHSGMVTEQEAFLMAEPVDTAIRVLAHRGPTWRAPLVIDVLRSLPIMRHVSTSKPCSHESYQTLSRAACPSMSSTQPYEPSVWKTNQVRDSVLQVPAKVLEQVLAHGRLLMYRSGRQIHESAPVRLAGFGNGTVLSECGCMYMYQCDAPPWPSKQHAPH